MNPNLSASAPLDVTFLAAAVYALVQWIIKPLIVTYWLPQESPYQDNVTRLAGFVVAYVLTLLNYMVQKPLTWQVAWLLLPTAAGIYSASALVYQIGVPKNSAVPVTPPDAAASAAPLAPGDSAPRLAPTVTVTEHAPPVTSGAPADTASAAAAEIVGVAVPQLATIADSVTPPQRDTILQLVTTSPAPAPVAPLAAPAAVPFQ